MRGSLASFALVLIACGPPPRDPGGVGDDDGTTDGRDPGNGDCADGTELVYTIDQFADKLSQFDPATKTFHDLGPLNCPTQTGATPFSMSVARDGTAWVLYNSGELFEVAIANLACTKTQWSSPNGLKVFGMGFSTDEAGGSSETLYVGGGQSQAPPFMLAAVNTASLTAMPIGMQPQLPEMTGTGNAELWGFFPDATTPRVVQFDKTTGAIVKSFNEPTLAASDPGYAFAHWGGDYWVFLIRNGEPSTNVYQVDGMTGAIESTTPTQNRTIVGAGVSTCAPVVIE